MPPSFSSLDVFDDQPTLSSSQYAAPGHASWSLRTPPGDLDNSMYCEIWGFLDQVYNGKSKEHRLTKAKTRFYFGRTGFADIPLPGRMLHLHNNHCVLNCEELKEGNGSISNRFSIQTNRPDCTYVRSLIYILVLI